MNQWIFLSHILTETTPIYGNRAGLTQIKTACMDKGDHCNSVTWNLPNHIGTHVDAPLHFHATGNSIDSYGADFGFLKTLWWLDCPTEADQLITPMDLEHSFVKISSSSKDIAPDCLLIRTGFEAFRKNNLYWEHNPGLHPETATWLRTKWPTLRMLGLDTISLSGWQNRPIGRLAHRNFLQSNSHKNPILIIEDMKLCELNSHQNLRQLIVAPLRVQNTDGAPCTIFGKVSL